MSDRIEDAHTENIELTTEKERPTAAGAGHTRPAKKSSDAERDARNSDLEFVLVASVFQVILLILYAISTDYEDATHEMSDHDHEFGTQPFYFYSMYMDVHSMMFVGFGFLMTFLRRYGFGSLSFNFIITAFAIQWGLYIFWMIPWWFGESPGVLHVTAYKLIDGDIAAAVVLISFGALLGRTNPAQLLVMCFFELIVWAINFHICVEYLGIIDVGGSIVVHTFGAYFGLAASFVLGKPSNDSENKSMYHSDMFAMIGTLFLWLYWPSFNGFFAMREYYFMDRAFVNTVLGLCGSTVSTFITTRLVKEGKFDMVHLQNSTLAGGVAVGAAADLYLHPAGAIGIGLVAGVLSVCGYEYLSDILDEKLAIADTCGVHNLHGMPGVLGGIVSAIAIAAAQGTGVYVEQGEDAYPFGDHSYGEQAGMQIASILLTIGMAVASGLAVGFVVSRMTPPTNEFKDNDNFIVPEGTDKFGKPKDYLRSTIRTQKFGTQRERDLDGFDALQADVATEEDAE